MGIEARIAGVEVGDHRPPVIMGVINISGESFYKGSVASEPDEAAARAKAMVDEGAEFLDVGAMSTNPRAPDLSEEEESKRLFSVLPGFLDAVEVPVSVDTQRPAVAEEALAMGASIINDVSAFRFDPRMAEVAADAGCPVILMATRKVHGDVLTMDDIIPALQESMEMGSRAGIKEDKMIVDPGIGFWVPEKTHGYDLEIIRRLEELRVLKRPVLAGISRKSFIAAVLGKQDPEDRFYGSLSATAIAVMNGAHVVRTHDVRETMDVVKMAWAIRRGGR